MNLELWEIFILTILSPILWIFSMVISVSVIAMIGAGVGVLYSMFDYCRISAWNWLVIKKYIKDRKIGD